MKIAMIIEAWHPIWGGGQEHVLRICNNLSKKNKVDLFVMNLDGNQNIEKINNNFKIYRVGKKTRWTFISRVFWIIKSTLYINKKIKKNKYEIVHGHSHLPGINLLILKLLNKNIKTIYTIHVASYFNKNKLTILEKFEHFLHTKIKYDSLILVGSFLKNYKYKSKNINIIGNGYIKNNIKTEIIYNKNDKINLLTVGRLCEQKGIDLLIKSMKYLNNNYYLNIVGNGNPKLYEELIKNNGLENRIKILEGSKKNINNLYANSDIFVLCSRYEGFGIVILEAFSNNLPVVSTKSGGVEDIIIDNENGFLVENFNPEKIAEKIIFVNELSEKSKEKIIEKGKEKLNIFTRENISKQIELEYEKILKIK